MHQLQRERNGEHTCDRLRDHHKRYLQSLYPTWQLGALSDAAEDTSWKPDERETFAQQQERSAAMLQIIASWSETFVYIASHSGTIATFLAVLQHPPHDLAPGRKGLSLTSSSICLLVGW